MSAVPLGSEPAAPQKSAEGPVPALVGQWVALGRILRGRPLEAFAVADSLPKFWLWTFGIASLTVGLFVATTVARVISAGNRAVSSLSYAMTGYRSSSYFGITFGDWLLFVLVGALLASLLYFGRVVALRLVFSVRGTSVPFEKAANIIAVSYTAHTIIGAIAFVLLFLPGVVLPTIVLFTAGALLSFFSFTAELLIYVGLNRAAEFKKSPLIPHALLTWTWAAVMSVLYTVILAAMIENS